MQSIDIEHPTPKQLLKLYRGEKVRVKRGTGFNLTVHPTTYNIVARAFNRDKGADIGLSAEELGAMNMPSGIQRLQQFDSSGNPIPLDANVNVGVGPTAMTHRNPLLHGQGILGKDFDKWLDKKAGRKKAVYKVAETFKPVAKAGVTAAIGAATVAGATALTPVLGPLGVPVAGAIGATAENYAMDYIDNPNKYHGKSGATHPHKTNDLGQQAEQIKHYENMNKQLGTNFDYMGKAGLGKAVDDQASAKMIEDSVKAKYPTAGRDRSASVPLGYGLHHHRLDRSVMGRGITMHHHSQVMPPAYESQPYGENFQMNHFLPPQFQTVKDIHGGGLVSHTYNLKQQLGYTTRNPHNTWFEGDFPESVTMPPSYTSKAEDVDFIRQSMKNPDSKPEAIHKKNKAIRKAKMGRGLYAGGHGSGLGP
jgi:hypothetical protein